ncbi:MAG: NUDIX pyrophosphatase [Actinomycetota bacterium]|nr:NUDIX pyrophosphatase [Actinomycetota bacterium]
MRLPHEVMVFIRRGDEYLVLHRSPAQESYWHTVSGAMEPGESSSEAAARELREETGLDAAAEVVDLHRTFVYPLAEEPESVRARFAPGVTEVMVECFAVEAPCGWEPALDWEHDDYRWCGAEEALELLYWPEPREVLRSLAGRSRPPG